MGSHGSLAVLLALRVLGLVLTLLATSLLVFSAVHLAPGDPAGFLLAGRSAGPEALAAVRAQYHLDEPFLAQYVQWLGGVVQGDFGRSVQFRQDVAGLVGARLPTTAALVAYASVIGVVAGVALGALSALRPGRVDKGVLVGTTVATATPPFVAAIALIALFAVRLDWFPAFGNGEGFLGSLRALTLPAVALAFSVVGLLARVTRSAMLDELGRDHVEVARSRGLPAGHVVSRHVLRNALAPIVTLTGVVVAGLVVSTSIVETAFGLPGVGSLLVQAVTVKDFPVVQAISLLAVAVFVLVNLAVDLLYPLLDPRVLAGRGRAA